MAQLVQPPPVGMRTAARARPDFFRAAAAEAAFYYQTTDRGGLAVAVSVRSGARLWQTELPSLVGWIISGTALTAVEDGQGASGLPSQRWVRSAQSATS